MQLRGNKNKNNVIKMDLIFFKNRSYSHGQISNLGINVWISFGIPYKQKVCIEILAESRHKDWSKSCIVFLILYKDTT